MCNEQLNKGKYYSCKGAMKGRHVAIGRHILTASHQHLCEVKIYTNDVEGRSLKILLTERGYICQAHDAILRGIDYQR